MIERRFRYLWLLLVLCAASCAGFKSNGHPRDLTFFVVSDLHYHWPAPGEVGLQRAAINEMNIVEGQPYPADVGGAVAEPRGVIAVGDLVESPANNAIAAFESDFGLNGERLLKWPVYEGLGNHDQRGTSCWDALQRRNKARPGVDHISENGYHYAWEWDGIRFIQLNLCGANESDPASPTKIEPKGALDFLKADLRAKVADSGRPVIILQHFDMQQPVWTDAQKGAFYEAIKGHNIACIVHGHTHRCETYDWRGITVLADGAVKNGLKDSRISSFLVFRIQGGRMQVLQRMVGGKWGKTLVEKEIGDPVAAGK